MVRGCGAQILRHRYFTYSGEVTLHARGEAGSLLSMGYARTAPYYIGRWSGYLTRAGTGGDPPLLLRRGRKRLRNRGVAIFFWKGLKRTCTAFAEYVTLHPEWNLPFISLQCYLELWNIHILDRREMKRKIFSWNFWLYKNNEVVLTYFDKLNLL